MRASKDRDRGKRMVHLEIGFQILRITKCIQKHVAILDVFHCEIYNQSRVDLKLSSKT